MVKLLISILVGEVVATQCVSGKSHSIKAIFQINHEGRSFQ
ncbi:hypothetical protein X559_1709 [Paenilisteria newyorkensis]|nr:hypothetical protein X559_1709 [Listeria newyorkensis]